MPTASHNVRCWGKSGSAQHMAKTTLLTQLGHWPLSMLDSRGSVRATRVLAWADTIGAFDQGARHEKAGIHQSCWWSGGGLASYSSCAELSISLHHNGGALRRWGHF